MVRTILASLVATVFVGVGAAEAAPITIVNSGFELPATGGETSTITGWVQSGGGSGTWNINADPLGFWTVPAPDGNQIAYLSSAPRPGAAASISQVLGDSLQPSTLYTLTGFEGEPIGFSSGTIFTAQLFEGINLLATMSGTGPAGSFAPFTLSFTSTAAGGLLQVRLSSNEPQVGFDHIALTASAVPEPASLFLLGSGLIGLAARERKRRRQAGIR